MVSVRAHSPTTEIAIVFHSNYAGKARKKRRNDGGGPAEGGLKPDTLARIASVKYMCGQKSPDRKPNRMEKGDGFRFNF